MDPAREKIVAMARGLVADKVCWRHQGRDPRTGLDCAGLILYVGWETELLDRSVDVQGYQRMPDGRTLASVLAANARQKCLDDWLPGDFVLLRDINTLWPYHLGFLVDRPGADWPNLIHSWAKMRRRVVEVGFDESWSARMVNVYSYRGLED